jgi:hypothetical protein
VKHDDIEAGTTYVGKGTSRRTRTVLVVGTAEECQVPAENRKFLKLSQSFVQYQCEDQTVTWDTLTSFAQWAASVDSGWPRMAKDGTYIVGIEAGRVTCETSGAVDLPPTAADELAQWLRDASRDVRASAKSEGRGEPL